MMPDGGTTSDIKVSFEFFPPDDPDGFNRLTHCAEQLGRFAPEFVSVTYGAGGTTRDRTRQVVRDLISGTELSVAGHLTCVGAKKQSVRDVIDEYLDCGVRHIVALRGDPPEGETDGTLANGYRSAAELVAGIRHRVDERGLDGFQISVGCHPEVHPRAASPKGDLDNLKRKIDAGADRAITQFFFETDTFLRFHDKARSAGIDVPIVPGIMPVRSFKGVVRFAQRCGTTIPAWMHELFGGLDETPEVRELVAATVSADQCRRLIDHGITEFHFYTMNRPELTSAVCHMLGLKADASCLGSPEQRVTVS